MIWQVWRGNKMSSESASSSLSSPENIVKASWIVSFVTQFRAQCTEHGAIDAQWRSHAKRITEFSGIPQIVMAPWPQCLFTLFNSWFSDLMRTSCFQVAVVFIMYCTFSHVKIILLYKVWKKLCKLALKKLNSLKNVFFWALPELPPSKCVKMAVSSSSGGVYTNT